MKILLLEDDRLFCETLTDFLEEEGYEVNSAYDPLSAYDLTYKYSYDLYLFDINLPFEDGIKALENLRKVNDTTPTIFITSREDKESLLDGFSVGADDYIKKPIDLDELLARIEALLKRSYKKHIIKLGQYILDFNRRDLLLNSKPQHIGLKSFALLELLVSKSSTTVSYDEIYETLWSGEYPSNGALRVYIAKLKRYFPDAIETIRGVGYRFEGSRV